MDETLQRFDTDHSTATCPKCGSTAFAVGTCSWCMLEHYARRQFWDLHLPTLAANLAAGAALCRAFTLGANAGYEDAAVGEGYSSWGEWRPGCQRPAP